MKILKSRKALSPVVASIILIAVTVAVSIAVAAWMGVLPGLFMATEQVKVTHHTWEAAVPPDYIILNVTNTGTGKATITGAEVTGLTVTDFSEYWSSKTTLDGVLEPGERASYKVTANFDKGITYNLYIVTAAGNKAPYTAISPT